MTNLFRFILFAFFSCLCLIPASFGHDGGRSTDPGKNKPVKTILLINSYHQGYLWTDEITRGVAQTLKGTGVDLHIEYLSTKRQLDPRLIDLFAKIMLIKEQKHQHDLIIASDNNALDFLKKRKKEIFGDHPVVFCGINYLSPDTVKGLTEYTGINERMDVQGNIDLIKHLHPDIRKIAVITDNTTTGQRNQAEIKRVAALPRNNHLDIELIVDVTINQLIERVKGFDKEMVALFTVFTRDKNDRFFEYEAVLEQVSRHSSIPLYATQNFSPGPAVVGGYLTNGFDQGTAAARKAMEILSGKTPSQVPIQWETPTNLRFDYRQLKRFSIPLNRLPDNAVILFQPRSFYQDHKKIIWFTTLCFGLLSLAFLGVSYGMLRARRAEKMVRESEKKYRYLFENAPAGMYEMDLAKEKPTHVNRIMCQLSGYSKDEFLSMSFPEILTEESRPKYQERIKLLRAGDPSVPTDVEYQMVRKDGQTRWVVLNCEFKYEKNTAVSARVVVHDITERKQLEELLVQSEKMLSVGGLAAGMAHEINNPLAGMMQNAQVIHNRLTKRMPANEKAAQESGVTIEQLSAYMEKRGILKQIEDINAAGKRAATIISNMLSFSRKSDSTKQPHDLDQLISTVLDLARNDYNLTKKYDFKQVAIHVDCQPDMPAVPCEKNKIEQVLFNIIKNASEAMASGTEPARDHRIDVTLYSDGDMACIDISDNGPGMNEDARKRIFEPFFTTKRPGSGTGLGLSVSYFIVVDDHKGSLSVSSAPGQGSTFSIRLPLDPFKKQKV